MGKGGLHQRGFILLPVVFAITLIAALAFLLSRGGPMALELSAGDSRDALALRVAQAGIAHAVWKADHSACTGYALAGTPFGDHAYSAGYSVTSGSPVDVTATATLADGATRSLTRRNLAIHQTPPAPLVLQPDAVQGVDAMLDESKQDKNYGATPALKLREQSGNSYRPVLLFKLAGVPLGARVLEAKLELYRLSSGSPAPGPLNLHAITSGWVEGDGNGDKNSDVTWTQRNTGTNWNRAGGDFDPAPAAGASLGAGVDTWIGWDITTLAQQWISGLRDNYGLLVKAGDGTASAEFAASDHNTAAWRPKLTITYACECGSVCTAPQGTGKVLLVVSNGSSPSGDDPYKKALFESWGYTVTYLDDSDDQAAFNTALGTHDVAYVSETVGSDLAGKLLATTKGVVYEEGGQNSQLGLASGFAQAVGASVDLVDNSHPITQGFATGTLSIYQKAMEGLKAGGTLAAGGQVLARWGADAGLIAVEKGGALINGTAAGRRVMLPLGRASKFNPAYLNHNGRLIVQRALTWAGEALVDPLTLGLLAHWKLDDGSGNSAVDSVGGHNGILTNGPTWGTGQLGGALRLDGSNDHVLVPHDAGLSLTAALTLTAWINPDVVTGWRTIAAKGTVSLKENYWIGLSGTALVFGFYDGGTYREFTSPSLGLAAGSWHHVAASFNDAANQVLIYLNGSLVHTATATTAPVTNSGSLMIGTSSLSEAFDGLLDDVRIYDRVLDAAELAQLAAPLGGGGGGGSCSGTLRDEFKARVYSGSDGTLAWATDWTEVNESDGPTGAFGDEIVGTDQSNYQLRVQDNDGGGEGAMRQANLSAHTAAVLSFDYRRVGLDDANDWVAAQVSKDGGAWVELGRFAGPATDAGYTAASYDIGAYIGANTRIRFFSSPTLGGSDAVWFDNVQIAASGCAP